MPAGILRPGTICLPGTILSDFPRARPLYSRGPPQNLFARDRPHQTSRTADTEKPTIRNQVQNPNSPGFSAIPCAVAVIVDIRMKNSVYVAFIVTSPCRSASLIYKLQQFPVRHSRGFNPCECWCLRVL